MISYEKTVDRLKLTGFKLTPQRIGIIRYLCGNTSHPSAQTIFNDLREAWPGLSLATVYNTLETLRSIGELQELSISKDRSYFDPDQTPHSHFICRRCDAIFDIEEPAEGHIPALEKDGFVTEKVTVYYTGLCPSCSSGSRKD